MKKSTAFLPTSLALAMAMALPSNVFAEQIISEEIKLTRTNNNPNNTSITADYNRIQAESESAELDTAKAQHNYTHIFDAQGNSIKDVSLGDFTRTNTSDARFNHLTETANDSVGQYTNHSIRGSDNLSFYTIDDEIDKSNSNLLDDSSDFKNPFVAEQATYAKSAMTLTNHNTNIHTNITADAGLQNFAFEVDASSQDVVRKEVFLNKDGITFIKTKVRYDPMSGEPQYEDIANGQGVTITPTGIKNLAVATEDGDAVSFGQTKQVIDEKVQASEQRITRSLNASIAGMIGTPPPTIIQTGSDNSAAIKKLNDNLAATDKRLDESNQRLNSAIDINDGVLTIKNDMNANNKKITKVANATDDGDAVNLGQLKAYDKRLDATNQRLNSAIDINDGVLTIKNDMNANNKKITKVANATDDGDAVNLGQLKAYVAGNSQAGAGMNQIKGDIVRLDKNLKQGMAAQSALNGLFQPYGVGKFSATAAIGGYGTETAVAVGTGYRFNENLAGKGGIAFPVGNASQATYNLGVNYEW